MIRSGRILSLAAWALFAACSGNRDETPDPGSAGGHGEGASPPSSGPDGSASATSHGTVPMRIAAEVDGKTYRASGPGECASNGEASIYQVPATLWHATWEGREGSEIRRLNLTVWRPKAGGPDMTGLTLDAGGTTHRIATVEGGTMAGSGAPDVRSAGKGGVLSVSGKDDHGDAIELTVECERFDEVVAEGG